MNDNDEYEAGGWALVDTEEEDEEDDVSEESSGAARHRLIDALAEFVTLDRIRSIVQAHPESVECDTDAKGNGDWCSALHMAIWAGTDYKIVRYLAKRNRTALRRRDQNGRLPLHLAVIYRSPLPVVWMLVEMHPDALRETIHHKRWRGYLPLHCTKLYELNMWGWDHDNYPNHWFHPDRPERPDVTAFLIQQYPAAARARTAAGHLPLHLAFGDDDVTLTAEERDDDQEVASIEVIDALLEAWPGSIHETDPLGRLAIHLACRTSRTPLAVIRRLVRGWPGALRRRDDHEGCMPIHHAIESGMPRDVIESLVAESPRSVRNPTRHGYLALHLLLTCFWKPRSPAELLDLVRLLVSHFPASVRHKGGSEEGGQDEGRLPLHEAVRFGAPLPVIRFLVRAYPESLLVKSDEGKLPLHLPLWRSDSPEVIQFLVDEGPKSLQVCMDGRRLALHAAAKDARSVEIVRIVHQAWPEAVREKTDKGYTPLHLVATRSFRQSEAAEGLSIVRYFLDQWPRSLQEASWTGELPVHLAAADASPDVVRLLVERGSKSLLLAGRDNDGALPLHCAVRRYFGPDDTLQVVQHLVDKAPEALLVADHRGHLPLHESVSDPNKFCDQYDWDRRRLPVVRHLVKSCPQALEAKDKSGRIPLLVAAESDASLDVLFHLLTSCPQSLGGGGGGIRHSRVPILRRSQRQRRAKRPRQS